DRAGRRGHLGQALRGDAVRVRRRDHGFVSWPVHHRLVGAPAAAPLRGDGMTVLLDPPRAPQRKRSDPAGSWRAWPLRDRILLGLCWAAGLALIAIAAAIVLYMAIKGIQFLRPHLLFEHPRAEIDQSKSGGFFDPLAGTLLIVAGALVIAAPL